MLPTSLATPINTTATTSHIHLYTQPLQLALNYVMVWDSIVDIATHYWLDGPGIESCITLTPLGHTRPLRGTLYLFFCQYT